MRRGRCDAVGDGDVVGESDGFALSDEVEIEIAVEGPAAVVSDLEAVEVGLLCRGEIATGPGGGVEGFLDGDGVVGIELGEDEVSGVADGGEACAGGFCVAEVINGDVNGGSVVSAL